MFPVCDFEGLEAYVETELAQSYAQKRPDEKRYANNKPRLIALPGVSIFYPELRDRPYHFTADYVETNTPAFGLIHPFVGVKPQTPLKR